MKGMLNHQLQQFDSLSLVQWHLKGREGYYPPLVHFIVKSSCSVAWTALTCFQSQIIDAPVCIPAFKSYKVI